MKVQPTKYWDIGTDDIRSVVLQRFVENLDEKVFNFESVDDIISACIDAFKSFKIAPDEEVSLKEAILKQNASMHDESLKNIRGELAALKSSRISIISLGCGDESVFERAISEDIKNNFSEIRLEWLGVDIEDYRSPTSFLHGMPFVKVEPDDEIEYKTLLNTQDPVVLLGRWSYHHLGISFEKFLERCKGIQKVILIEEPASMELWALSDYKVMRIAYDLLGNIIMSHSWASEFMKDAKKFKVRYLTPEALPQGVRVINFQKVLPETSLVVSKL